MLQIQQMARQKIESKENSRVKLARKTRDGNDRGHMFVEGLRISEEALRSDVQIEFALVREGFDLNERARELLRRIDDRKTEVFEVGGRIFDSVAETRSPQGIILICRRPLNGSRGFSRKLSGDSPGLNIIVVLHEINNPSNLGAILRTAEAAGVRAVVLTTGSADPFSPTSIRASMGSAFRMPIWENAELGQVVSWAEENNFTVTSTAGGAARAYTEVDWVLPRVLIFGPEAHGLDSNVLGNSADVISIPMTDAVESLNLAVAAGIILFEARRRSGILNAAGSIR
jgi:TrmH family RNA methyltransferase